MRSQSYLVVPCKKLGVVLEYVLLSQPPQRTRDLTWGARSLSSRYALLRRQQCLNELAFGLRPESRHGNMYLSHGGRSMEFEREEEVCRLVLAREVVASDECVRMAGV